jgi:hypothetical protein
MTYDRTHIDLTGTGLYRIEFSLQGVQIRKRSKPLTRLEEDSSERQRTVRPEDSAMSIWGQVYRPLCYGGLGVQDLERAGIALRLRWMWLI